ncbi:hypothetical protein RFI_14869 [Reticulomyxa filosa]|uniref:Uncharacterized protein n=1 Tax=Reticulomyxa filosa TaxID=46433 RepID=X6N8G3_RETFI|nr:hypothetical protein RFI_14869 [Reticulomyxa filosa]|eukprot:ETO22331.1 hypothetical protein RFI_14869 [Reticulomyxa filosa]
MGSSQSSSGSSSGKQQPPPAPAPAPPPPAGATPATPAAPTVPADPAFAWLKDNNTIMLAHVRDTGEQGSYLYVLNAEGTMGLTEQQKRPCQWKIEVVDAAQQLVKLKAVHNTRYLRVSEPKKKKLSTKKPKLVCKANGSGEEEEDIIFKVMKDEAVTQASADAPAVQFQCQGNKNRFLGAVRQKSKKKKKLTWAVIAAQPGDGTFWKIKVVGVPKL